MIEILKESTILYVEDDPDCRKSVLSVFNNIFKKVLIACDGLEALEHYNQNKNTIDIIVSDINMPKLDGIELLKKIRTIDEKLPFLITSAHRESDYLLNSIELNVSAYITKPIDIKILVQKIANICKEKDNTNKLLLKEQEVQLYLEAINKVAIVSKTDLKGKITYVNDIFCEISQHDKEELIGKNHNIVRHPDTSKEVFKNMWKELEKGNKWKGKLKNTAKDGSEYYVNTTIFPLYDNTSKQITEYIGIRFLTTIEDRKKRAFKKKVIANISENKQKEYQLVNNKNDLEQELKILSDLNIEHDNRIIELNKYILSLQDNIDDLEEKNIAKDRQLSHYELEIQNVDQRVSHLSKKKINELDKYIHLNEELKTEQELLLKEKKNLEDNISIINKKNQILKSDNITKLKRIEELEDVISFMEDN